MPGVSRPVELRRAGPFVGMLSGPLTRRPNRWGESTLGDAVADAVQAGSVAWAVNVASIVSARDLHADLGRTGRHREVRVSAEDLVRVLPIRLASTIVTITGDQLCTGLEQEIAAVGRPASVSSAMHVVLLSGRGRRHPRVDPASVTVGGAPLDPAATYIVTLSDTLRSRRRSGGFADAVPITGTAIGVGGAGAGALFDSMAAYLATASVSGGRLDVPALDRIEAS